MKRIANNRVITVTIAIILLSPAYSQDVAMNNKTKENSINVPAPKVQPGEINYVNEVNSKVLRSFYKAYGEVQDAKWSKTDNGFAVNFKTEGLINNVFYKKSGAVEYKIKYYFEEQLPADVRHIVKANFYDYTIRQVSEVSKDNGTGYFVKIESKYTIKTVRVIGAEFEVVEDMIKK